MPKNEQPGKPGSIIDQIAKLDGVLGKAEAKVKALREQRETLCTDLIGAFRDAGNLTSATGRKARAHITNTRFATVEPDGWPKLYAYIKKHDAFDLLQRRITTTALVDRLDAGESVPSVKIEKRIGVSITKL